MVYVAFSEYFFDSAMHAYFQAGVLAIELQGEKVSCARTGRCLWAGGRAGLFLQGEKLRPGSSSTGIHSNHSLTLWCFGFILPAGAQGPGGFAQSHLLWDHLHAGVRSTQREAQGGLGTGHSPVQLYVPTHLPSPEPSRGCSPAAGAAGISSPPLHHQTLGHLRLCLCLPQHLAGATRSSCSPALQHGHGEGHAGLGLQHTKSISHTHGIAPVSQSQGLAGPWHRSSSLAAVAPQGCGSAPSLPRRPS